MKDLAKDVAKDLVQRLNDTVRGEVLGMHSYVVQDAQGLIKLDAMENPFELPADLRERLGRRLAEVPLNRYPGPRAEALREALARYAALPEGCGLMLGNGSDELISLLALACAKRGATVLAPTPGFVMYEMSARLQGLGFVGVDLREDFSLDEAAMLEAIRVHRPAIVYLAYPNNPTANLWDEAVMDRLIEAAPGWVVIDEAYQPFASRSFHDRLKRYPHVLLMRTLSKFGLAGVRLGYLMGERAVIDEIDKVRPPYNVSVLNTEAALFALEHADEFERQAAVLRRERDTLLAALAALPGVTVYPSQANMIVVRLPDAQAGFEGLRQRGILVKNVSHMHRLLANCLRLTVGTPEENSTLLAALKATLS